MFIFTIYVALISTRVYMQKQEDLIADNHCWLPVYMCSSYSSCMACEKLCMLKNLFIIFIANWGTEPKSASLLWRALQQLGTW